MTQEDDVDLRRSQRSSARTQTNAGKLIAGNLVVLPGQSEHYVQQPEQEASSHETIRMGGKVAKQPLRHVAPSSRSNLINDEPEMIRFNLDMTAELNAKLDFLAKRGGVSKGAVVRKAIALLFIVLEGLKDGYRLGFVTDPNLLTKEIIGMEL